MSWVLEDGLTVVIVGSLISLAAAALWLQTGHKLLLYGTAAAAALTGGLYLLERIVETDRETLQRTIEAIARDVERNDLDAVLGWVHSSAPSLRESAAAEFPQYEFHQIRVKKNLEVEFDPHASPPEAEARFNVVVVLSDRRGNLKHQNIPRYVVVRFRKDGEQWKVADYSHSDPRDGLLRDGPRREAR